MATIKVRQASRLGNYAKPYVAKILGSHPQYKFDRRFLSESTKVFGGEWTFEIEEDGLYEVCDRNSKGVKRPYWCVFSNGVLQEFVPDAVVGEHLAVLDDAQAAREASEQQRRDALAAQAKQDKAEAIATNPIANAQAATELAAEKAETLGVQKDTWLPYVRAALTFWSRIQARALEDDNTRASFEAASQQLEFGKEFQKLTGRAFALEADQISYQEIESL